MGPSKTSGTLPLQGQDGSSSTGPTGEADGTTQSGATTSSSPEAREPPVSPSGAPKRKVLASAVGAGLGGNISVILTFHLPTMPPEVVAAYTSVLIALLGMVFAYLVPAED